MRKTLITSVFLYFFSKVNSLDRMEVFEGTVNIEKPLEPSSSGLKFGAADESRTHMDCSATPSRWCVYQFRHGRKFS